MPTRPLSVYSIRRSTYSDLWLRVTCAHLSIQRQSEYSLGVRMLFVGELYPIEHSSAIAIRGVSTYPLIRECASA